MVKTVTVTTYSCRECGCDYDDQWDAENCCPPECNVREFTKYECEKCQATYCERLDALTCEDAHKDGDPPVDVNPLEIAAKDPEQQKLC
jgi:hypothetical protein